MAKKKEDNGKARQPRKPAAKPASSEQKPSRAAPRRAVGRKKAVAPEAQETPQPSPSVPSTTESVSLPHSHQPMDKGPSIPPHYGQDRLGVLVRDAGWLFCYWELEGGGCQRIIDAHGKAFLDASRWVLRVTPGGGPTYDVQIDPNARNWYLKVAPKTRYHLELGVISPKGEFIRLAVGNDVETPREGPGEIGEAEWGSLREELQRLIEMGAAGGSLFAVGSRGFLRSVRVLPRRRPAPGTEELSKVGLPHGYLMLVLHAHLPYVRHPEYEKFLEESWLFEAITETYVPLADELFRLADEGVRARLAIVLSPPLCEMLSDPLLQRRYEAHLDRLIACADAAFAEKRGTPFHSAAEMYCSRLRRIRDLYRSWDRNPLNAFRKLSERGVIEILTCAATHGLLPLMARRTSVRAQIEIGCRNYEKHFGRRPEGIWLPECAFAPGIDELLAASGLRYFFVDAHGLLNGSPMPRYLTYRPVLTPAGVAVFARDPETGIQVWSSEHGYPGDPVYREFYRDLGYDGRLELVRDCLYADGVRSNIGLKYHRVTGKVPLDKKEPYVPDWARKCAAAHAEHFVSTNEERVSSLRRDLGTRPVICAMYDAELFGHWWFEGVDFLSDVLRKAARIGSALEPVTPHEFLACEDTFQIVTPSASSWGDKGYYEHWLNGTNDWIYPHLHAAEAAMGELANRFPSADGWVRRALNQAARELLLMQSSDWAFLMTTGTAKRYATQRTNDHVERFNRLYKMLMSGAIDQDYLSQIESRDAIFQELDYRIYAGR